MPSRRTDEPEGGAESAKFNLLRINEMLYLGIRRIGTLGILRKAKKAGLIVEIKIYIEQLRTKITNAIALSPNITNAIALLQHYKCDRTFPSTQ